MKASPYILKNDLVEGDESYLGPFGLPFDTQPTSPPPGLESTVGSVSNPPAISTATGVWEKVKQWDLAAGDWIVNAVKKDYALVKGGVSTVAGDVVAPIEEKATSTYWYLLLGVVVIAGAIYFIGKSGAVKVNAIV